MLRGRLTACAINGGCRKRLPECNGGGCAFKAIAQGHLIEACDVHNHYYRPGHYAVNERKRWVKRGSLHVHCVVGPVAELVALVIDGLQADARGGVIAPDREQ